MPNATVHPGQPGTWEPRTPVPIDAPTAVVQYSEATGLTTLVADRGLRAADLVDHLARLVPADAPLLRVAGDVDISVITFGPPPVRPEVSPGD